MIDIKPGLNFVEMRHDLGCPAIESQVATDCTCNAEFAKVSEKTFIANIQKSRKERRKAQRATEKAIRKARGL